MRVYCFSLTKHFINWTVNYRLFIKNKKILKALQYHQCIQSISLVKKNFTDFLNKINVCRSPNSGEKN